MIRENTRLFNKDFGLMVLGQIVSILGSAILRFALNLYVLDVTGRADIFAFVLAISAIPGIVFMPIGGVVADRVNRRNLMVIFDFANSAIVLSMILLIGAGFMSVTLVGVVLAILFLISSMYQPAVQASVPVLVKDEQLTSANGIVSGVGSISSLMGPVIGGVLYKAIGLQTLVAVSCAAFLLSAVMEIFIHIPFIKKKSDKAIVQTILDDMRIGIRYIIRENPILFKTILLAAALNMLLSPFIIVGVPYVLRVTMQSNDIMYGIGLGIGQLSMVLGAILASALTSRITYSTLYKYILALAVLLLPMAVAVTPWMLGLGYWPSFTTFFFFEALFMLINTGINIYAITTIQKETPNEMLGKVMSIVFTVAQCVVPLGQALYGTVLELFKSSIYIAVLMAFLSTAIIALIGKKLLGSFSPRIEDAAALDTPN